MPRIVNANLADYHVPVHADIRHIDAFYVEEHDPHVNPIGAKGLAELSIVGDRRGRGQRRLPRHRQTHSRLADHDRQAAVTSCFDGVVPQRPADENALV